MPVSIAIDGPSGAGKSTIARKAAQELGYVYVDTGAMYRCIGLFMKRKDIDISDKNAVAAALSGVEIGVSYKSDGQIMRLCGEDVTEAIRVPEISKFASDVSAIPEVRTFLLELQRGLARENNVIMDGRDIGTVILPNAQIKIFLTASPEDRALRRFTELVKKGFDVTYDDILISLNDRDANDSSRVFAPLRPAEDAVIIDTTGNELEKSIEIIINHIKEKLKCFYII